MKILVLALSLISLNSFAQTAGKPFQLNPGRYTFECWSSHVGNSTNQGKFQTDRDVSYAFGSTTVVQQGEFFVEVEQGQSIDGDFKDVFSSVSKTIFVDLGNGQFKRQDESDSSSQAENGEVLNSHSKSEVILNVDGNKSQNLLVTNDNQPQKAGVGESNWMRMSDGRIVTQMYLREKTVREPNGNRFESLVGNSTCVYTPQK